MFTTTQIKEGHSKVYSINSKQLSIINYQLSKLKAKSEKEIGISDLLFTKLFTAHC
ncbi:hypothetical protein AEQU1_00020 [Aequorivita sp. CIP111184]|nr:hypothetical protein AEQU1_00020 [Aequorivita sp. CIP111184]